MPQPRPRSFVHRVLAASLICAAMLGACSDDEEGAPTGGVDATAERAGDEAHIADGAREAELESDAVVGDTSDGADGGSETSLDAPAIDSPGDSMHDASPAPDVASDTADSAYASDSSDSKDAPPTDAADAGLDAPPDV